jgi:site-specific recombinase XerD
MLINIVRAVVNQVVGNCKTEVSRKPLSWMITLQALMAWRQESTYTALTDWIWASLQKKGRQPLWLATVMRYLLDPAGSTTAGIDKRTGWHAYGHTFSTLIKSLGVDAKVVHELLRHASFKTKMDG